MKNLHIKQTALILFLFLFSVNYIFAQSLKKTPVNQEIDSYANTIMNRNKIPGVALAVIKDGRVIHKNYYGQASIEFNVPVDNKNLFRLYSTTKLFVAVGVFKLIEENKISLDDPITKYVNGLPENWHSVKIKHLLTHSSGLPDMTPFTVFRDLNEEEAKAKVFKEEIKFPVGEQYSYNQTNFWLLQKIIEKVTGQKFADYILNNQFGSKKESVLFSSDSRDIILHRATPYFPFNERRIQIDTSYAGEYRQSANGLNITLDEFIKWDQKFDQNVFISKKSKADMWTPFIYKKAKDFAYGWEIHPLKDQKSYGFTGSFVTGYRKFPKENVSIIILTNGFERFYQIDDAIDYLAGLVAPNLVDENIVAAELITAGFLEGDVNETISNYGKWKKRVPDANFERLLNVLGYQVLSKGKIDDALEIFKLNTREYPNSWNVWDSLGETYQAKGDFENAILNYEKAIKLNTSNPDYNAQLEKRIADLKQKLNK